MTLQKLIDRALALIGVIEAGEVANATDSATGLTVLNGMMSKWSTTEKDFNWFEQDTLTDTFPVPDWAAEDILILFAVQCAPEWRAPITQNLYDRSLESNNALLRTLISLKREEADMRHIPLGAPTSYNILTDL